MSGHCKACDSVLTDEDLIKKDMFGNYTELCTFCLVTTQRAEQELHSSIMDGDFFRSGRRTAHLYDD